VSSIAFVRTFPAGARLSYGGTHVTEKETRVGYVPVGYAHGYPRALSNRGSVIVAGRRCRVLGMVCMDWTLVDLTGVPAAKTGVEVVLLGSAEGASVTADEMARETGSIPYEILCGISKRFKRVYVP
jgi:alanine racemase